MLLIIRGNVYKKVYNGAVMNNLMNKMLAVNWIMSLCTINNWEGRMPPDSSEQWVFRLLRESMLPSRQEFRPTACMMGWSVPKASDSASAGMARFQHWLPWLGKDCSPCGINISTRCLTLDWASLKSIIQACKQTACPLADFESTEECISSIDKSLGSWQEEESVPPTSSTKERICFLTWHMRYGCSYRVRYHCKC